MRISKGQAVCLIGSENQLNILPAPLKYAFIILTPEIKQFEALGDIGIYNVSVDFLQEISGVTRKRILFKRGE